MSRDDPFIRRVVGRRKAPPAEHAPSAEARAAFEKMAKYRTRAPKGVYVYGSHAEANRDRERWLTLAVSQSGIPPAGND